MLLGTFPLIFNLINTIPKTKEFTFVFFNYSNSILHVSFGMPFGNVVQFHFITGADWSVRPGQQTQSVPSFALRKI